MNLIKKLLSKYLIKYNINGKNNKILAIRNKKEFIIWKKNRKIDIKITGSNNTITIDYTNTKHKLCLPDGLKILINGNNNNIHITMPSRFLDSSLILRGDYNIFKIGYSKWRTQNAIFSIYDGGTIEIGNNCQMIAGNLFVKIEDDGELKHKIYIGDDTYIARECIIRASDGHTLYDIDTKNPLNPPDDIIIGKNCWITSRCIIIKGSVLPNNTVVGANSLINKKFTEENTLIAGSPAKVIRKNVFWSQKGFATYIKQLTKNIND